MFLVVLLTQVFVIATSSASSAIFEDCGSAYKLEKVYIDGCNMRLPCYVTLGEELPVSVEFYADFASLKLDQDVVISINLVNLSTDVTPEPCETVDCPVKTNALNSFTSVLSVPRQMALNQRGYLRWRVYNERHQVVLCYSILVQTQSPLQKKLREILSTQLEGNEQLDEAINNIGLNATLNSDFNDTTGHDYLREVVEEYFRKQHK